MPTSNPVPSQDPSDLLFNAGKLDEVVNGAANSFTDRLGVARRTVAGMNADFDAQLADAESDLNVYRADAAASAAEALGYLQTIRATSYGAYAEDPATDPLGNPPTEGDEYFNTTANLLKRWNGTTWQASDINTANLAAPSGSSLVGYLPDGAGAVATTVQEALRRTVNVKDFGADPSASASANTAAIQAAANYCEVTGAYLEGLPGTYSISGMIELRCSGDLSTMTLNAAGASMTGPAVRVGRIDGSNYSSRLDLKLPEIINTSKVGTNWSTAGSHPGVEIANVYHSIITLNYTYGFAIGWDIGGYDWGNGLNTFHCIGYAHNNAVNIRIKPKGAAGWANDNLFLGVNARIDSDHSGVVGTRNIQILPFDITNATTSWPNNNLFLKPTIEGNAPEYHIEISGSDNVITSPRIETSGATTQKILLSGHASETKTVRNLIYAGYSSTNYVFTEAGVCLGNGVTSSSFNVYNTYVAKPIISFKNNFSPAAPHIRAYPLDATGLLNAANEDTNWVYQFTAAGAEFKPTASANPTVKINATGFVYLDTGAATPAKYIVGSAGAGIRVSSDFYPSADNSVNLGSTSLRWGVVYAATGTINTSDQREKQQIRDLSEAERAVAIRLKKLFRAFKFNEAVEKKGDDARIHVGVIAQDVIAAFEAEGLNPMRYAIVCYDEWEEDPEILDDEGNVLRPASPAGNRYGVRYEELLAFMIAAL